MKSDYIEFHQDGESLFIKKDAIIAFGMSDSTDYNSKISTIDGANWEIDETIEQVKKALNV